MDINYIFKILEIFQEMQYFYLILIIVSYFYLLLPLPVTPLIIFNSIYFQELSIYLNLFLILLSYLTVYKIIVFLKLNLILEKYVFSRVKKKFFYFNLNLNEFWKVLILRVIIPIPLLNYYLSIKNYKLGISLLATFISLIPYVLILSGTSKDLISEDRGINLSFFILYIFYALTVILLSKFIQKIKFFKIFK